MGTSPRVPRTLLVILLSSLKKYAKKFCTFPFGLVVSLKETFTNTHFDDLFRFCSTTWSMAVVCSLCGEDTAEEQEITCVVLGGNPCWACKERADIQDQMKRLEQEMIKLKAKYRALGTTVNAIHDPFIHKFPPEIGSHIFRLCLPTPLTHSIFDYPSCTQEAFLWALKLGAVCRKWRELAWATPNLWETLSITVIPSTLRTLARSWPGLISEWLGRSGVLPLTITFRRDGFSSNDEEEEEFDDATNRIIEVINSHSSRWRHLSLKVDADIPERFSGSMDPNQLFLLELAVYGRRSLTQNFMMKSKPFPTHLTLDNFSPTSIDIGWDNIIHATLSNISANECVEVLRRAPAVEYFTASDFIRPSDNSPVNVDALVHPRIRSLHLSNKSSKILDMIKIPALKEWTHFQESRHLPVDAMVSLIKRSGCYLKILNLQYIPVRSENLPSLFQAMPSLERLKIQFRSSSQNVNDVLDDILLRIFRSPPDKSTIPANPSRETFLPCLQFMNCKTQFSWDRVPQLYRQGHRHSLTLKAPANRSQTSDETAMELLKLVDEGAKFVISDDLEGGDFLTNFRKRMGSEGR